MSNKSRLITGDPRFLTNFSMVINENSDKIGSMKSIGAFNNQNNSQSNPVSTVTSAISIGSLLLMGVGN